MTICTNVLNEPVPVDPSVFDLEYLIVPDVEDIVTDYKADNFYHGSSSITDILATVKAIDEGVTNSGYFYDVYPEKIDLMKSIQSDIEAFQTKKTSFDEGIAGSAASSYNDDIEKARKMQYRIELQENCETYNGEGTSIEHSDYSTRPRIQCDIKYWKKNLEPGETVEYYTATVKYGHFDDSGWVVDGDNRDIMDCGDYNYNVIGSTDTYDSIKYSFGSNWANSFDGAADGVRKKLDARGYPVIDRSDKLIRPANTKYSGSGGSGVSGN